MPQRFLVANPLFKTISEIFYWFCLKFSLLPITFKGMHNIPKEPCIIVANHQSSFDIPLIGNALKNKTHVWLAWTELTKSPLLKLILPRNSVLVDTSSPIKGMRTLVEAINLVKAKPWDLIIFPEGARHTDGKVHEFLGGFSVIAKKIDRPVIPIKIIGVNKVYPPKTFWIHFHPITVIIGGPMHIGPHETDQEFKERVHAWFLHPHEE
jgi:1-acyl-sn-glycerol-3-phosphate acyltransferase